MNLNQNKLLLLILIIINLIYFAQLNPIPNNTSSSLIAEKKNQSDDTSCISPLQDPLPKLESFSLDLVCVLFLFFFDFFLNTFLYRNFFLNF